MRSIAIAIVAALVAAPALSAQQAADQVPATQIEVQSTAPAAPAAVPAAVAPAQSHLADMEVVQPRFNDARDSDVAAAQVDNRTRNILAVVGAVVVVLALLAFIR
jgi:hypothetical protein